MKNKMSVELRQYLSYITHGPRDPQNDPKIFYHIYHLLLKENLGLLPAQRMLERSAALDYGPACVDLAMLYHNGRYLNDGFEFVQDEKKMVEWLQRAADFGNVQACILMAHCCYTGTGISINEQLASYYISKIDNESLRIIFSQSNCQDSQTYLTEIGIIPTQILYMQTLKKKGPAKK